MMCATYSEMLRKKIRETETEKKKANIVKC